MTVFEDPISRQRGQTRHTRSVVPKFERTAQQINQAIKEYIESKDRDFSILSLVKRELGINTESEITKATKSDLFQNLLAKNPKLRALYDRIVKRNLP